MILTIYKSGQLGTAKAIANLHYEAGELRLIADEKFILNIIKKIIHLPAQVKIRQDKKVFKRKPLNVKEHLYHSLRNKLHSPYWVGPKNMILEAPKYKEKMGVVDIEEIIAA